MEKTQDNVEDVAKLPSIPPPVATYPPRSSHGSMTSITSETDSESRFGLSKKEIERLGRIRPEAFQSSWSEVGFVLSICMAQILTVCGAPRLFPPQKKKEKKREEGCLNPPHTHHIRDPLFTPDGFHINRRKDMSALHIISNLSPRGRSLANAYLYRNILSRASTCLCHQ